jgi:hypothetical protein
MPTIYANPPSACDLCKEPIGDEFSDASLPFFGGIWGNVCSKCARRNAVRYGTGLGQRYERNADGQYVKTED